MAFNLKKVLKALLYSSGQPLAMKDIQSTFERFHRQAAAAPEGAAPAPAPAAAVPEAFAARAAGDTATVTVTYNYQAFLTFYSKFLSRTLTAPSVVPVE